MTDDFLVALAAKVSVDVITTAQWRLFWQREHFV